MIMKDLGVSESARLRPNAKNTLFMGASAMIFFPNAAQREQEV